jgi:hypothetical protein
MKKRVFNMFTALVAVISLSLLPSCAVEDIKAAIEDSNIDLTQFQDVPDLLGSDDGGVTLAEAGTGIALRIAETITVIDVSDTATAAKPDSGIAGALHAIADLRALDSYATSDYKDALDNQEIWVEDRANEAFEMATMILCYMGEIEYDSMVNQGAYLALVDTNKCETSRDDKDNAGSDLQESQSGGSANAEATNINYERWVVVSHREDNNSPQNVRFWVEGGQGEGEGTIEARLIIWEGKSTTNPLGLFKLNFQEIDSAGTALMKGYLEAVKSEDTDDVQLRFVMDMEREDCFGTMAMFQAGTLVRDTDADGAFTGTGKGRAQSTTTYPANVSFANCGGPGEEKPGSGTAGARNEGDGGGPPPVDVKFTMAYNADYFKRKGEMTPMNVDNTGLGTVGTATSGEVCLDRANPDESAWRYGLFADENATVPGEALQVNSGFPITWTDTAGEKQHGHVGYWGLWDPTEALTNGYIVTEEVWGDTDAANYTIFKGGGKLTKHSKQTMTLAQLEDVDLISGMEIANPDYDSGVASGPGNEPSFWKQLILHWTGDTTGMMIVGEIDEQNWQPIYYGTGSDATTADLDDTTNESAFTPREDDWNIWFWSEALGGGGYVVLKEDDGAGAQQNVTLSGTSVAVFHMSSVVAPGDTVPASLACFNDCPDGALIDTASPYNPDSTWDTMWTETGVRTTHFEVVNNGYWDFETNAWVDGTAFDTTATNGGLTAGVNFAAYSFDTTAYELTDSANLSIERTDAATGDLSWGVWTGPMVDLSVQATRDDLACDWDATQLCSWKLHNAETYYTWETGTDEWSKYTGLKNADTTFVKFDPPFKVTYDDPANGMYVLEYGGYGDLWGIPGICVNQDTGAEVDCWDETVEFMRYVPAFTIADNSVVTAVNQNDGTSAGDYYVLALEKEQRLKAVDATNCSDLEIDENLTLPTIDLWVDPTIGTMPVITSAPAVIDGVVQEAPAS